MAKVKNPNRIKSLRAKLGLSQQELAEKLGVNQATVSRIEAGKTPSRPVARLLEIIADAK